MRKTNLKSAFCSAFLMCCLVMQVIAQRPVRLGPASDSEIKKARTALDSNLNNIQAHQKYIYAMGLSNPLLIAQYRAWVK